MASKKEELEKESQRRSKQNPLSGRFKRWRKDMGLTLRDVADRVTAKDRDRAMKWKERVEGD